MYIIQECIERNILKRQKKCDHDYEFNNKRKNLPTSVQDKMITVIKKKQDSKVQVC